MVRRKAFRPLYSHEAEAVLLLWGSGVFDTNDIALLLRIGEDAVSRTVQAARDMAILLAREVAR